jgi:mannose-6-phosphate isomerase-like protein (cupin superfamily)
MTENVAHASRVGKVDREQAQAYEWGSIQWLASGRQIPDSQMTFGYVEINPGVKNPKHLHPNCDEVLFVVEGELDHSLDDQVFHLTPGMTIHIPTGVPHDARNTGASVARVIVAYSTGDRQTTMCEAGGE